MSMDKGRADVNVGFAVVAEPLVPKFNQVERFFLDAVWVYDAKLADVCAGALSADGFDVGFFDHDGLPFPFDVASKLSPSYDDSKNFGE